MSRRSVTAAAVATMKPVEPAKNSLGVERTSPHPRRYVIWSGGADSTLCLVRALDDAKNGKGAIPTALTLVHPQMNSSKDRLGEELARKNFLRWARKRFGKKVDHQLVIVKLKGSGTGIDSAFGQAGTFMMSLFPYVADSYTKPIVEFGYIRHDDYWHTRHQYEHVWTELMRMSGAKAELSFPLEWVTKKDVLDALKEWKLPRDCWWTCDRVERMRAGKPIACGRCLKCKAVGAKPTKPLRVRGEKAEAKKA